MRPYPRILDWMRYVSAFLLYGYGLSKIAHLQFHLNASLGQRPVSSLTGYELTWYYYGYSRVYACILGATQVVGASLLLFRKTALIGAVAMLPVIVNILLIDIFILPPDDGPTVPALIIFVSLVTIVWRDLTALMQMNRTLQEAVPTGSSKLHFWIRAAILTTVITITLVGILGRK